MRLRPVVALRLWQALQLAAIAAVPVLSGLLVYLYKSHDNAGAGICAVGLVGAAVVVFSARVEIRNAGWRVQ